jgi:hypothetical protein
VNVAPAGIWTPPKVLGQTGTEGDAEVVVVVEVVVEEDEEVDEDEEPSDITATEAAPKFSTNTSAMPES